MYGGQSRLVVIGFYELKHPVVEKLTVKLSFVAEWSVSKCL